MQSRNWFLDSPLLVTIGDRLHNPTLHNILAFKENVLNGKFKSFHRSKYVFRHASVSSTYRGQPLWALTKRQDSNVVADIVADNVVDMEVDKVADIAADKKILADMELDMVTDMEIEKDMAANMFKTKCIKHEMF